MRGGLAMTSRDGDDRLIGAMTILDGPRNDGLL